MMKFSANIGKSDIDNTEWQETNEHIFFGMMKDKPTIKVVCRERTYIIPACQFTPALRYLAVATIDNKTGDVKAKELIIA